MLRPRPSSNPNPPPQQNLQVLDKQNSKQVHQQRSDAKAQEAHQRYRVGAETPIQVSLLRLWLRLLHGAIKIYRQMCRSDRGIVPLLFLAAENQLSGVFFDQGGRGVGGIR